MEQDHANSFPGLGPGAQGGSAAEPGRDLLGPGIMVVDGRYRLASIVARNSNDTIYSALDERARSRVRLRIVAHPPDPLLLGLDHPTISRALDSGRIGRWHYVVLEWLDGRPLELPQPSHRTDSGVATEIDPAADLPRLRSWAMAAMDLLDALEHAHARTGRIHGEIGTSGLWAGSDGRLRFLDFSTADATRPIGADAVPFASPERLRGLPCDVRSDLYSVAGVLYALAYGSPPFGVDPIDSRAGHLLRQLQPPASRGTSAAFLPQAFFAVLRTAMEKQPQHRYASAARMRAALQVAVQTTLQTPLQEIETPSTDAGVPDPSVLDTVVPSADTDDLETDIVADGTMDVPPVRRFVPVPPEEETTRRVPRRLLARHARATGEDDAGSGTLAMGIGVVMIGVITSAVAWVSVVAVLALVASRPEREPPVQALPPIAIHRPPVPTPVVLAPEPEPVVPVESAVPPVQDVPVAFPANGYRAEPQGAFPTFVALVREHRGVVRLTGHTDSRGPADVNMKMGLGRAWAVKKLLALAGIEIVRVPIASKGETEPVADNETAAGRAANRRVTAEFFAPGAVVPTP